MSVLYSFKTIYLFLFLLTISCHQDTKKQHSNLTQEDFRQVVPYIHIHGIYYSLDVTSAKNNNVPDYIIEETEKSLDKTNRDIDKEIENFTNDDGTIGSYQLSLTEFKDKKSLRQDSSNLSQRNHTIILSREKRHHQNYAESTTFHEIDTLYIGDIEQFKR